MNRNRIAWDTQLGIAVAGITTTSIGPALPFLIVEHGLSLTVAGILFAFFSGGRTTSVVLSTLIADRLPRKTLLLTGHGCFAVGLVSFAVSPTFVLHLVGIGVAGLGFGFTDAISNAVITEVFHDRRGFALNRLHAFFGLGSIIGPAFAALVLASGGHWRIIFSFAAAIAVAVTVFTALTDIPERGGTFDDEHTAPDASSTSTGNREGTNSVLRDTLLFLMTPALILPAFAVLIFTGVTHGLIGWMNTYFVEVMGASATVATIVLLSYNSGITVGRFVCGSYADRLGFRPTMIVNAAAAAVSLIVAATTRSLILGAVAYTLGGFFLAGITPVAVAIATTFASHRPGETAARLFVFGATGSLIIPFSMGAVSDYFSLDVGIGFVGFLVAVIVGLGLGVPRSFQRGRARADARE